VSDAARLTLQVAAFLQSEPEAPRSASRWAFAPSPNPWPGGAGCTFAEAAAYLESLAKPIIVGALNHPGLIAVWRATALDTSEREYVDHLLANQLAGFTEMISHLNPGGADVILFEGWGALTRVSVTAFQQWLREYGLTWGWRLGPPSDGTHRARLLVWQGAKRWSPGESSSRS
jgi:hypothetical protein